jgi:oligopeptide transport system ATP-binding protein
VGESGSGKTSIGRAIIRVYPVASGEVHLSAVSASAGASPRRWTTWSPSRIQMIFQDPMASLNERAKVSYIVSEGLLSGAEGT